MLETVVILSGFWAQPQIHGVFFFFSFFFFSARQYVTQCRQQFDFDASRINARKVGTTVPRSGDTHGRMA
jgi:hypothetical protein